MPTSSQGLFRASCGTHLLHVLLCQQLSSNTAVPHLRQTTTPLNKDEMTDKGCQRDTSSIKPAVCLFLFFHLKTDTSFGGSTAGHHAWEIQRWAEARAPLTGIFILQTRIGKQLCKWTHRVKYASYEGQPRKDCLSSKIHVMQSTKQKWCTTGIACPMFSPWIIIFT